MTSTRSPFTYKSRTCQYCCSYERRAVNTILITKGTASEISTLPLNRNVWKQTVYFALWHDLQIGITKRLNLQSWMSLISIISKHTCESPAHVWIETLKISFLYSFLFFSLFFFLHNFKDLFTSISPYQSFSRYTMPALRFL